MLGLVHVNISSKEKRWKWLMEKNLLKSFSQRVTAVFQYLDKENLGFFSLTDMNEKGGEVFDYLCINLDHTSFGFMDTFRKIDVDGSGEIDEDEFAVGVIELLRTFKNNHPLLEEIANEVMPLGNISWDELQLILENNQAGAEQAQMQILNKHFGAMLYIFEEKVNINAARPDMDVVDVDGFVAVMRECVDEAIVDLRRHFHLPRKSKLDFAKSIKETDIMTALEKYKMVPAVWDIQSFAENRRVTIGGRRSKRSKVSDSVKKSDEENKCATLIPAHGEVVRHVKSLGVDPFDERVVEGIDEDHVRLIQSLVKSIGHFMDLVAGRTSDVEALSIQLMADGNLDQNSRDSVATIMTMERMLGKLTARENMRTLAGAGSVVSGAGDEGAVVLGGQDMVEKALMQKLLEVQEKILYKDVRLKLLELMQSHTMAQASDPDSLLDVDDSLPEFYSVEAIIGEMRLVKAAISKGGYDDSMLSLLLEEEYAIVPVGEGDVEGGGDNELGKPTSLNDAEVDDGSTSATGTGKYEDENGGGSDDDGDKGDPDDWTITMMLRNINSVIKNVQRKGGFTPGLPNNDEVSRLEATRNQAAEMAQLTQLREEVEHERNDMMHYQVEVQMLREKSQRVDESEHAVIQMKSKNLELQRKVFEMEQQVKESQQARVAAESKAEAVRPYELESTLKNVERELRETQHQRNKLARENKRLVLSTKQNEERYSTVLQENVNLRNEMNGYKDDLTASTVFLAAMQKKVEQERVLRSDREELAGELRDVKRQLALKDTDLAESTEEGKLARKFKAELENMEDRNRDMRDRVRMLEAENERGLHIMEQMDEYRRALREKEAEVREMQIRLYKQEATIQELKYSESRSSAMEEEIAMYKNKVEKIPALVSEVARLRGSSRATSKALDDQDRQLGEYKRSSSVLDRENSRLKSELRRHVDSEQKVADAQEHMGRIKAYISTSYKDTPRSSNYEVEHAASGIKTPSAALGMADLSTPSVPNSHATKPMHGDYKKVRRMMRQSIVANSGVVRPALSKTIEAAIESAMSPDPKQSTMSSPK